MNNRCFFLRVIATVLLSAALPAQALPQAASAKKKIATQGDLPRFTYPVPGGSVLKLVQSETDWAPFAARVRADVEGLLRDYDIQDKSTLRSLYYTLLGLEELEGHDDAARRDIAVLRSLEEKPAAKLMSVLLDEALLKARREANGDEAALRTAFNRLYADSLDKLPWEVVREEVKRQKTLAESYTASVALGLAQSQLEPAAQKTGSVSGDAAGQLVSLRWYLRVSSPLQEQRVEALRTYMAAHREVAKPDIWAARSVTLTADQKLTPVVIGIWDSGVDTKLFPSQVLTSTDASGIAFDLQGKPSLDLLYPLTAEQHQQYPEARKLLKGWMDLSAALDTPEASALKQRETALKPDEVKPYFENLSLFSQYIHGTHVAGIALNGNPAARLVVGRITLPHKIIPDLISPEEMRRVAGTLQQTAVFFRAKHTRVVNISWGSSPRFFEQMLEANGAGKDADERRQMARELFDIEKSGMLGAIKNSPEILFVCAAGNTNNNNAFDEYIPGSFQLSNLLTVGAADQAGEETSFTTSGPTVAVHANGYEVESLLPGGEKLSLSGTSMASPNVTNLAAKLLALDPALKPVQVIALIKQGATRSEDGRRNLINPKRSVELLQAGKQNRR